MFCDIYNRDIVGNHIVNRHHVNYIRLRLTFPYFSCNCLCLNIHWIQFRYQILSITNHTNNQRYHNVRQILCIHIYIYIYTTSIMISSNMTKTKQRNRNLNPNGRHWGLWIIVIDHYYIEISSVDKQIVNIRIQVSYVIFNYSQIILWYSHTHPYIYIYT